MSNTWFNKYYQKHYTPSDDQNQEDEFDVFYGHSDFHCPVDTDKAWQKIHSRINPKRSLALDQIIWRIAAILVIAVGMSFLVYNVTVRSTQQPIDIVSAESTKEVLLPDGSMVTLAKSSKIRFDQASFLKDRTIRLVGQAYFDIVKNKHPFKIETPHGEVEVLGTTFNLQTNGQLDLAVYSGKVKVTSGKQKQMVLVGQRATAKNGSIRISEAIEANTISWKTGEFDFQEERVKDIVPLLEEYYNIRIVTTSKLKKCRITANFNQSSLDEVIDIISTVLKAETTQEGNKITFRGKGCN